jgi:HK97 gp10 family phage protein
MIEMRWEGMEELRAELNKAADEVRKKAALIVRQAAANVRNATVMRIQRGPASGRIYQSSVSGATHQASREGEAPATDSGNLANSYFVAQEDELTWVVASPLPYARFLEFGTQKMGARPHLLPSVEEEAPKMRAALKGLIG